MGKIRLQSVLEQLVNEDHAQADKILHQWFVEKCNEINKKLIREDVNIHVHGEKPEDVSVHGQSNKKVLTDDDCSFVTTLSLPSGEEEVSVSHDPSGSIISVMLVNSGEDITDQLSPEDLSSLEQEASENQGNADWDMDEADADPTDNEEPVDDEFGDLGSEEGSEEGSEDEFGDLGDEESEPDDEDGEPDPSEIEDQVSDLESELKELKAQLKAFIEDEGEEKEGKDVDSKKNPDAKADKKGDHEEPDGDEDEEGNEPGEEDKDEVEESFDFLDLEEAFQLEKVDDPNLSGTKEIGKDGKPVKVNITSPIPQKKTTDRVGGSTVQIRSTQVKGYERETPPKVEPKNGLKNQVMNADKGLKPVPEGGDKAALINKKGDGFGNDSPKSPIGAGATDLRGNTFKRS